MGNEKLVAWLEQNKRVIFVYSTLILILLIGAAFRLNKLSWDEGQSFHPDERAIIVEGSSGGTLNLMTVPLYGNCGNQPSTRVPVDFIPNGISFFFPSSGSNIKNVACNQPVPQEAINFWNPQYSPLNPRFYAYGHFPMYLIKFGGWVASSVTGQDWDTYAQLMLVGRFLSVLFSLGTIAVTFFLARRIFAPSSGRSAGDALGLLAAAFLSVAVLDIQLAHFLTFDVPLTFFITLTLYFAVGHMRSGSRRSAIAMGVAFGMALGCKFSAAPLVLPIIVATVFYGLYGRAQNSGEIAGKPNYLSFADEEARYRKWGLGRRLVGRTMVNLLIAGVVTFVVFFLVMPYAIIDFGKWIERIVSESGMTRGEDYFPYTRQYVGSVPVLYQMGNLIQWGVGIPIGLLSVGGILFSLWQALKVRVKAEIILLAWTVPYMAFIFTFEAKFNRYLLPFLPMLLILAARLIIHFTTETQRHRDNVPQIVNRQSSIVNYLVAGVGVFAFLWGAVYAISFSSIYSKPHSRVAASQWIYDNIPPGSTISAEVWDEALPVPIQGKRFSYNQIGLDIYGDRLNDEAIAYFVEQLLKLDYIILASDRLYETIPKLPWRYPVQNQFYEMLFDGRMGFSKVAEFTSYPTVPLFNWQLNDDRADESFNVYDHPKVLIFKKTSPLNEAQYNGLFAGVRDAPWIVSRKPKPQDFPVYQAGTGDGALLSTGMAQRRDEGKSLLLNKPVDQLPVIDDFKWNQFATDNHWFAVIVWLVLFQVFGLIGLPIAMRVARRLPDSGYILAKPIGAAFVALIIWLMVSTRLWMNTVETAYFALFIAIGISLALGWRYREHMLDWFSRNRRIVLVQELVFLVGFALFLFIRYMNPDLWHPYFGGEKPMEMTHINSILKSAYFPPYDPWFSDGYINYYYYGQYLAATWIKLTGIELKVAFNLAIPIIYAFVFAGAFSLVYNMAMGYKLRQARIKGQDLDRVSRAGAVVAGAFGSFMLALAGNLDAIVQVLQRDKGFVNLINNLNLYPLKASTVRNFDYFRSSRVVPNTVNEFPFWSFLYADLHAHVIALPYTLVLLTLAMNLLSTGWAGYSDEGQNWLVKMGRRLWHMLDGSLIVLAVFAMVLGLIAATNLWDLPTYSLLIAAAFFFGLFRKPPNPVSTELEAEEVRHRFQPLNLLAYVVMAGALTGIVIVSAYALYTNFFSNYYALFSSVRFTQYFTEVGQFVFIHILPLFLIATYLIWNIGKWFNYARLRPSPQDPDDSSASTPHPNLAQVLPQGERESVPLSRSLTSQYQMALAGADGGAGFGSGGGRFDKPRYQPGGFRFNKFSAPFVFFTLLVAVMALWLMFTTPRWGLLAGCLLFGLAAVMLTLPRAYDPNPKQAAEARAPHDLFARLLIILGFCVAGGTEVIYLVDNMGGGEYQRFNTVFKFYYQVWVLFAIAGAFFAYVLWTRWIAPPKEENLNPNRYNVTRRGGRMLWVGTLSLIVATVSAFLILGTPARIAERGSEPPPPPTLDGLAYFDTLRTVTGMQAMSPGKVFDMVYEAQSLREFYSKVSGTPVVLQPSIFPYRGNGNWVPINTGLPNVLGFDNHQRQQRYPQMVSLRSDSAAKDGTIREIYNTPDIATALALLNRYRVTYIHMGVIEREGEVWSFQARPGQLCAEGRPAAYDGWCYEPLMSNEGYAKFDQMVKLGYLEIAYQNPGVTVLKLTPKGFSGVVDGKVTPPSNTGSVTGGDPRLARLEDAIKRNPTNFQARYDLGLYYKQIRQLAKAAEQFQIAVQLRPKEVNPYHVLGDIYAEIGDFNLALETYKQATIQAPTVPAAFNKYAMALQSVQRFDEALNNYNQALKLDKSFVEASYHIGEIYEVQGKKEDARAAYQRTIDNAPDGNNFWARRAIERIALLK